MTLNQYSECSIIFTGDFEIIWPGTASEITLYYEEWSVDSSGYCGGTDPAYSSTAMTISGTSYTGTIPATACAVAIDFYEATATQVFNVSEYIGCTANVLTQATPGKKKHTIGSTSTTFSTTWT